MAGPAATVDLSPDIKVKHLTFGSEIYSTSKLASIIGNIYDQLQTILRMTQNIDVNGNFYMPIGKKNGIQQYKKITTYIEPETNAILSDVSTTTYIKTATGEFQEVNNA